MPMKDGSTDTVQQSLDHYADRYKAKAEPPRGILESESDGGGGKTIGFPKADPKGYLG